MGIKASARELATLALAKSIIENDAEGARAALKKNANYEAFWLDGATQLRKLAQHRGAKAVSQAIDEAALSKGVKGLPALAEDPSRWSKSLVEFIAQRGYNFEGRTRLQSGSPGTNLRGLDTAQATAKLIVSKWDRIKDARCENVRRGSMSDWRLTFCPTWSGSKRVAGFDIRFAVDACVRDLIAMFESAKAQGNATDPPDLSNPLLSKQKDWEASIVAEKYFDFGRDVDGAIDCLREGGNPFDKTFQTDNGQFTWDSEEDERKLFMAFVRREVGPGPGWHIRIAPLLTESGIEALKAKFELEQAALKT